MSQQLSQENNKRRSGNERYIGGHFRSVQRNNHRDHPYWFFVFLFEIFILKEKSAAHTKKMCFFFLFKDIEVILCFRKMMHV
jgi:hypothetical protein